MKIGSNSILAGLFFGTMMGIFFSIIYGVFIGINGFLYGLLSGVLCGIVFSFFIFLFTKYQSKKFIGARNEIINGQKLVMDGAANHFLNKEAVGGWLYMTEKELIFASHKVNIQNHTLRIPFYSIRKVTLALTLGLVPNGLHIETNNGVIEKFVVNDRKLWEHNINLKLSKIQVLDFYDC